MRYNYSDGGAKNDMSRAKQGTVRQGNAIQQYIVHNTNYNIPQQLAISRCLTSAAVLALPLAVPPLGKEEASRCASRVSGQNVPSKGVLTVRSCHVRYRTYSVQLSK